MAEKRFYWLRLKETFFEDDNIRIVERLPSGEKYLVFYLKLMLKAIKGNGILRHKMDIPYTQEMLSAVTYTDVQTVTDAMECLKRLKMVEILDDGALYMSEVEELTGSESGSAERVRRHRGKGTPLQCNDGVTESNKTVTPDKETEIDKDLELKSTPIAPSGGTGVRQTGKGAATPNRTIRLFQEFWEAYPKKSGKGAAENAFKKLRPDKELFRTMLAALEQARGSAQWERDTGRYIPNPATWLNQKRWEDEYTPVHAASAQGGKQGIRDYDEEF